MSTVTPTTANFTRLTNAQVADLLHEIADRLKRQGANPFRAAAYRRAADTIRRAGEPLWQIHERAGVAGLEQLPRVGHSLSRRIAGMFRLGCSTYLERMRRRQESDDLLTTLPGVGDELAGRLRAVGIHSLEEAFNAATSGRLARVEGVGRKRVQAIQDSLAFRLNRDALPAQPAPLPSGPSIGNLLEIDRRYREQAALGRLMTIAPKRFNPTRAAWLPVMRVRRHGRRYCAHFANTAQSHRLGKHRDWVVIRCLDKEAFGQWTVVTARAGTPQEQRLIRGLERECRAYYDRARLVQLPPEGLGDEAAR